MSRIRQAAQKWLDAGDHRYVVHVSTRILRPGEEWAPEHYLTLIERPARGERYEVERLIDPDGDPQIVDDMARELAAKIQGSTAAERRSR